MNEQKLQPLANLWREANPNIVRYWWAIDEAVKTAIRKHIETEVGDLCFQVRNGMLFITLPSGRRLSYVRPQLDENCFGGECVTYSGTNAQKKWDRIESYGPKFVENIVQAISRDILAEAMKNLQDYAIVGHIHDEIIIEADPETKVETICSIMSQTPEWIKGLSLRAEGYECESYRKE